MNEFTRLSVDEFLDRLSDRTPTPGGGAAAAAGGALSCAMGRMVAAYSVGKKTLEEVGGRIEPAREKLRCLDEMLRRMIAEDAVAYSYMTSVDRSDVPAYQAAVIAAVSVPLGIAAAASEALEVLDDLKGDASHYLLSDLGVAAVMADATARSAAYSVRVNLPEVSDRETRDRLGGDIRRIVGHCDRRRASIEAFVQDRLSE